MSRPVPFSRPRAPLAPEIAKKLPQNLDAERSVLGTILLDNTALKDLIGVLNPSDFFLTQHGKIFSAMMAMALSRAKDGEKDFAIDLVTLTDSLQASGELDAAGGAPYLASLADGMPRVSNVKHYAKLIVEKSRLRRLIHATHQIQQQALDDNAGPDTLLRNAEEQIKQLAVSNTHENPAVVVTGDELMSLELPKAVPLIDPLLTRAGTAMIYSWAGVGKSWVATDIAIRLASGVGEIFGGHRGMGGHWPLLGPTRVLYLYGEMHGEKIRERIAQICKGQEIDLPNNLGVMSKDYQRIPRAPRVSHTWRPCIGPDEKHRRFIEDRLFGEGYEMLVLDNLSTLWSAAQEEQSKQIAVLKDWFVDLNARGISVLFLQHAGKSGDFLGDSAQVHILDSVLKLTVPPGHKKKDGLRAILDLGKIRYKLADPRWAVPFEASLVSSHDGEGVQWLTRSAREGQKKAAFQMFKDKVPPMFVAQEVGVSKATVYRWKSDFDENSNFEFHSDKDEED